ncbi:DUF3306 domain-containing protein [Halomonas heilongjiangensis]|uniref:DUF3306 domain-containing protein n=1 Tax=Halomonas heilongjiangensis TaxID=1387883 RepID=A0A2N7TR12_9GAMM|nr:DUF3306 domain-containing protein [Halomonas heilongjiangensis]PMR70630.1 DUF3306 domain-containing protein [Halomonas heilongjiangensis]PXX88814.1 hypothetical protein CR158_12220 [Halomonas heilongjiangensis]
MSRLSRWSRRKLGEETDGVEAPDTARAAVEQAPEIETVDPEAPAPPPPEPGSLDHTLPDPDTLPPGSDFTAFLRQGVSDGLRRRALRRMFSGDHYGIRDGLDDYDADYRERLKPLAGELAQRLRQWTRQASEPETADDAPEAIDDAELAEDGAERRRETPACADENADDARREADSSDGAGASRED